VHDYAALQVSDLIEYRLSKTQLSSDPIPLDYQKMLQVVQALHQTVLDGDGEDESDNNVFARSLNKVKAVFE